MNLAALHLAILRGAAQLVPVVQRAEWLAEWRGELWQAWHEPGERNVVRMCLGAFWDAIWLRRNRSAAPVSYLLHWLKPGAFPAAESFPDPPGGFAPLIVDTPWRCLRSLGGLLVAAFCVAMALPGSRGVVLPALRGDDSELALVQPFERAWDVPAVTQREYLRLRTSLHRLGYYRPVPVRVSTPAKSNAVLVIAEASANLRDVLEIRAPGKGPQLMLSAGAWQKYYGSSKEIIGRTVSLGGRHVVVAGVAPKGPWLPGNVDAWLFSDGEPVTSGRGYDAGFAVVRGAVKGNGSFRFMTVPNRSARLLLMLIWGIAVGGLLAVASILLPWTPSPARRRVDSRGTQVRRGMFVAGKVLLLVPTVAFAGLALASVGGEVLPVVIHYSIFGGALAVRWALVDQRRRCPVCLARLANPVRIGGASRMLLEWHGTELVCLRGHGLMHVPSSPAIWFDRQRWVPLDPSWSGLFRL